MADNWESLAAYPASRWGVQGGVIADKLYVSGGTGGGDQSSGWVYDPASDSWSSIAAMPATWVWGASAVDSGLLYVLTGLSAGNRSNQGVYYNPGSDTWTSTANAPTARAQATAAAYGGSIYVFGGVKDGAPDFPSSVKTVERYDPGSNSWATLTSMPAERDFQAAATIGSYIYVVGGESSATYGGTVYATLYRYDPAGDSWSTLTSMTVARYAPQVGVINGNLYVAGGRDSVGNGVTTLEMYDPATDTWTSKASMPSVGRGGGGYGVIAGKYLHVAAGWSTSAVNTHQRYVAVGGGVKVRGFVIYR